MNKIELLIQQLTIARLNAGGVPPVRDTSLLEDFKAQSHGKKLVGKNPLGIPNPFQPLPNVKASWIKANKLDPLLEQFSIVNKFSPEMRFDALSRRVKASNRYLRINHFRLVRFLLNGDASGFWRFAMCYMSKSKVLKVVALRKLDSNWHANFALNRVKLLLSKLQSKIDSLDNALAIRRDYASKVLPDGTPSFRPIGNPAYHDRMFLYLWQSFFTIFLYHYISKSQHAYKRGFGVLTAWNELKDLIPDYNFIYEYDLKGAFPSTSIDYVFDRLGDLGLPSQIAKFLKSQALNTVPELDRAKQELPEPKIDLQQALQDIFPVGTPMEEIDHLSLWTPPVIKDPAKVTPVQNALWFWDFPKDQQDFLTELFDWTNSGHSALDDLAARAPKPHHQGLPEGSGLSPVLFAFAFEDSLTRKHFLVKHPKAKLLAYADDFLLLSKTAVSNFLESSDALVRAGFKFAANKCRSLRDDSGWLVEKWKFLGITHFTESDTLVGTPRSGKVLPFDKQDAVAAFQLRERRLWSLVRSFPAFGRNPAEVLDSWGREEGAAAFLPESFINGSTDLSYSSCKDILSHYLDSISESADSSVPPKAKTWYKSYHRVSPYGGSHSMKWLATRLGGSLLSRLHDGQWHRTSEHVALLPQPAESAKGRSWLSLRSNPVISPKVIGQKFANVKTLELHNSTSFATVDLLQILRDPRSVKISKDGLTYRYAPPAAAIYPEWLHSYCQLAGRTPESFIAYSLHVDAKTQRRPGSFYRLFQGLWFTKGWWKTGIIPASRRKALGLPPV